MGTVRAHLERAVWKYQTGDDAMSEGPPPGREPLPPNGDRRLDRICDRFEDAWKADQPPRIEDFLGECQGTQRQTLLRELLRLEIHYRLQKGERLHPEEFRARFPEDVDIIADLLDGLESTGSVSTVAQVPVQADPEPLTPLPAVGDHTTLTPLPVDPAAPDLPALPGYELLGRLDEGGMGVVYRARQVNLQRIVAVKMIRGQGCRDEQLLARFRIEATAVARLDHPHIVRIHDFGEQDGQPYFAMEFVEGGSLAQKLRGNPLPLEQAVPLVEALARAIHYAHEQKIIHRDLKPANVLLKAIDHPKIADFGLAKHLDVDQTLTPSTAVMGTASYMAPEQAEGQTGAVGPLTDVYALGAIFYETLTGKPPFKAATRELTILQVLTEEPVPPTQWRPDVPTELEAVCLKCLEKERGQRYPSAEALAEDLRRFRQGESLSIRPLSEWERQVRWGLRAGYELLEPIGCTALGIVYKARHLRLKDRIVTLKTISAQARDEPAKMARFRAEAELVARLQHPNIVHVYDFGECQGQSYFSLESLDGGDLAETCAGTLLPASQTAQLVETLARATHYAHQQGIIHTDLRPFNVRFTTTGVPKIAGFGLARLLAKRETESPLQGARRGLSNYMAPEQVEGNAEAIGPGSDVHALGAMMYEMLTGRPPFLADTVQETLHQIRTLKPASPTQIQPDLPHRLEDICLKCLRKDPGERYASAELLADELHRFVEREQARTDEFQMVPGYELLEELGLGGTGVVYKAMQLSFNRPVALKIFREELNRYLIANQALARLQHPNIVQLYDCGKREGMLYVAEELIEGMTLDEQIAAGPQPPREAAGLVETLARAVHYIHQNHIVHRNLKPRVIHLTAHGIPKISSFDLAKLLGHEQEEAEMEGQVTGTGPYMAPEQAAGQVSKIGAATDVHALGIILHEMLTGRRLFPGNHPLELLQRVQVQEPIPPRHLQPDVSPQLDSICLQCLQKDPAKRYPSAEALADALHSYLVGKRLPQIGRVWRRVFGWFRPQPPTTQ
jgi:serine/threonine protein kinase